MKIPYDDVREYLLTQPFVEEAGAYDNLRFNPFILETNPTVLSNLESSLGEINSKSASQSLSEYPALIEMAKGMFDWPEGTFILYLDGTMDKDYQFVNFKQLSAGLTEYSVFEDLVKSGIHFRAPEPFLHLVHELRLKQDIAKNLSERYNLKFHKSKTDSGLVVETRNFPDYSEMNRLLDFCGAYHGIVNKPEFENEIISLTQGVNSKIENIS